MMTTTVMTMTMSKKKLFKLILLTAIATLCLLTLLFGCKAKSFTVTFVTADLFELSVDSIMIKDGDVPELPKPELKEGYTFLGWYLDEGWNNEFSGKVTGDLTLYMGYSKDEAELKSSDYCFVSFNGQAYSKGIVRKIVKKGSEYSVPAISDFDRKGYSVSWYSDAEKQTPYLDGTVISNAKTLYLDYTPITYTVKIAYNGGVPIAPEKGISFDLLINDTPQEYNVEKTIFLPQLKKEGYSFVTYYDNPDFEGDEASHFLFEVKPQDYSRVGSLENLTFYAYFEPMRVIVNLNLYYADAVFESDGTSESKQIEYNFESEDIPLPVAAMDGYKFVGWWYEYGGEKIIITSIPKGSYVIKELRPEFIKVD